MIKTALLWIAAFVLGSVLYGAGRAALMWWCTFRRGDHRAWCVRCGDRASTRNRVYKRQLASPAVAGRIPPALLQICDRCWTSRTAWFRQAGRLTIRPVWVSPEDRIEGL